MLSVATTPLGRREHIQHCAAKLQASVERQCLSSMVWAQRPWADLGLKLGQQRVLVMAVPSTDSWCPLAKKRPLPKSSGSAALMASVGGRPQPGHAQG